MDPLARNRAQDVNDMAFPCPFRPGKDQNIAFRIDVFHSQATDCRWIEWLVLYNFKASSLDSLQTDRATGTACAEVIDQGVAPWWVKSQIPSLKSRRSERSLSSMGRSGESVNVLFIATVLGSSSLH